MLIQSSNVMESSTAVPNDLMGRLLVETTMEVTAYTGAEDCTKPIKAAQLASDEAYKINLELSEGLRDDCAKTDVHVKKLENRGPPLSKGPEATMKGPTPEMKQHLSEVKKKIKSKKYYFSGEKFSAAGFSQAGCSSERKGNEDRFSLVDEVAPGVQLLAVYDGHGGDEASEYLRERFPQELSKRILLQGEQRNIPQALRKAIATCDEKFCEQFLPDDDRSEEDEEEEDGGKENGYVSDGSCLVAALLCSADNSLVLANVGDCRAVLGLRGSDAPPIVHLPDSSNGCCQADPLLEGKHKEAKARYAIALTSDHDAGNPNELKRIHDFGGTVTEDGYVFGEMQPSRAIGDVQFKGGDPEIPEGIIISDPEIRVYKDLPDAAVLILATDGLWDVMSNEASVDFTDRFAAWTFGQIGDPKSLREACECLVGEAADRGSEDDISVVMMQLGQ